MKKSLYIVSCIGLCLACPVQANWVAIENVIPTEYRGEAGTAAQSAALITTSLTENIVKDVLGAQASGWYHNTKNGANKVSTPFEYTDGQISVTLNYPKASGGAFIAFKSTDIGANALDIYEQLKFSFSTGAPADSSKLGQGYNFFLFYGAGDSETGSFYQIGDAVNGYTSTLHDRSFEWTINKSECEPLFEQGGNLYLVMNTTSGGAWQQMSMTDFKLMGEVIPEPSAAALGLLGLSALMMRRRRA